LCAARSIVHFLYVPYPSLGVACRRRCFFTRKILPTGILPTRAEQYSPTMRRRITGVRYGRAWDAVIRLALCICLASRHSDRTADRGTKRSPAIPIAWSKICCGYFLFLVFVALATYRAGYLLFAIG